MKKYLLTLPNLLFVVLLGVVIWPYSELAKIDYYTKNPSKLHEPTVFLVVLVLIHIYYLIQARRNNKYRVANDIATVVYLLLLAWELVTMKFNIVSRIYIYFPPPENIFYVFFSDYKEILTGLVYSMRLLVIGFTLGIFFGVVLGLVVGWIPRLRKAVFPIAKAVSSVPALVYTPYVVMLMPSFIFASIFVIFLGVFWPTFMNMINRVGTIDHKIIDTAKVLNTPLHTTLFRVILPYTLPRIINNLTVMISVAIMTLTAAEMLGSNSGIGYFIRKYSVMIDYTRTIAGILFIALVVTMLNWLVDLLKKKLVRWDY
jgi:NitT/TauT family transport system permease protein